ncbi:MAG: indolepyruvate ferredoxin oxidoreductase [Bacteroidales bacterium]|jgi:indolepyruvate ferredoxin oxidoreductase alpha subunit|nr:indolepyruvate ferredoxin oxidoreductase [Bacteroidales bacterium]
MQKLLLLGDEAIAQGALDAGLSGVYAYPGTPSTEITEYIQHSKQAADNGVHRDWSSNEKTAMEAAIGMSYAGKRALVCMKHVGLNVAADAFMNAAIVGANGGLVILSADDPSMHSSQNEQDSRVFGKFALIPMLEPSNQQECYDMVQYAFDFSEKYRVPVLMRITTRLAHSRAGVIRKNPRKQNEIHIPENLRQYVLLPAISRKNYKELLLKQNDFINNAINDGWNTLTMGSNKKYGIIAAGLGYNYLMENFPDRNIPYSVLKITQYPLPTDMLIKLATETEELIVMEDGYPFIEEQIKSLIPSSLIVHGRLDGTLPRDGELNPNLIAKALKIDKGEFNVIPEVVKPRPPKLCDGCPHINSYLALNEALKDYTPGRVFADIGCYTLGALPPYNAINTCVDMGASITMAKGATDAGILPAVAVIGDSTFTHSGMTGLLDAVWEKSPITIMILDNSTTAMTGGQDSNAYTKLESICKGLGVEENHIKIINPLPKFHEENVKTIKEELDYNGVSVIIPKRECIQTIGKKKRTC